MLRNQRYTGDGGIDGRVWIPTIGWCALQVKRFRRPIDVADVQRFGAVLAERAFRGGLFVHTGRTGGTVYRQITGLPILLVSGDALLRLLLGSPGAVRAMLLRSLMHRCVD